MRTQKVFTRDNNIQKRLSMKIISRTDGSTYQMLFLIKNTMAKKRKTVKKAAKKTTKKRKAAKKRK